uniref:Uncharacterized protein n=1 Tax=uncultured marine crenarchaeote HF4000_APKG3E18 TaxID=455585 RepID=B3T7G7_9ARCH|nr:hypothetical protein ALOHA_HF4000APKG3E18ctg2g1 [uncultured marine crenarchaeote HF4000_APKG3E18]
MNIAAGVEESSFSTPPAIDEYLAAYLLISAANDAAAASIMKKNELLRLAHAST